MKKGLLISLLLCNLSIANCISQNLNYQLDISFPENDTNFINVVLTNNSETTIIIDSNIALESNYSKYWNLSIKFEENNLITHPYFIANRYLSQYTSKEKVLKRGKSFTFQIPFNINQLYDENKEEVTSSGKKGKYFIQLKTQLLNPSDIIVKSNVLELEIE